MSLVYQNIVDGYQLTYFNDGKAFLTLNGNQLWAQTWAKDWTDLYFFKCNCRYYLVSYKEVDGTIESDEITHVGYTCLKRFTIEAGFKTISYYAYLDNRNDIFVFRKPGKAVYYDFECRDGSLTQYKSDDGCGCPTTVSPCGTVGSVPVIYNGLVNLRSSSEYNANHGVQHAILNYKTDAKIGPGADGSDSWSAQFLDQQQYILAGSVVPLEYLAIQVQGRGDADQWVKTYKIRYTLDNVNWREYNGGQIINANSDRNTISTFTFPAPLRARSIALHPLSWNNHISLRLELYARPGSY
eukprot:gene7796-9595_t